MDVRVDYRLTGTGWSSCTVELSGQTCVVTASYLSDALRELVSATNAVLAGAQEARFRFDEEPGEYRWILSSTADGGLRVKILGLSAALGREARFGRKNPFGGDLSGQAVRRSGAVGIEPNTR